MSIKNEDSDNTIIEITNYPSDINMIELIDSHYKNSSKSVEYKINIYSKKLSFIFIRNEDAFDFIQFMTKLKFMNRMFKRIKINMRYRFIDHRNRVFIPKSTKGSSFISKSTNSKNNITNYYKNQEYIRTSSPYMTEEEKRRKEEKENRSKFLNKKGFFCCVGKYSIEKMRLKTEKSELLLPEIKSPKHLILI